MNNITRPHSRPLLGVVVLALVLFASACADQGAGSTAPTGAPTGAPASTVAAAPVEEATAAATNTAVVPPATVAPSPEATTAAAESETPATAPATATAATAETPAAQPSATAAPAAPDIAALAIELAPVAEGLTDPLFVTHAGDGSGRTFVVEKTGAIRIIADGRLLESPFLDISDRVRSSGSEQGLLGLAFPPDYANRKFFFVNYTNTSGDTVVGRYNVTDDPNAADPGSEFVVLTFDQPAANHNGGDLAFGPDGYLWIGTGDGGAANDRFGNGQNPNTVLGKMLRLDVTSDLDKPYVIPPDNPSVSQGWQVIPEVWAVGLRNPWRYSFDRATGDLWIADVGQNRIEEVNVVRAGSPGGLNFGWPIMEGANCFQGANCDQGGLVMPVATYEHGADGCSITGGYVYRGQEFPSLAGVYLYGDYCSGRMWALDAANPGQPRLLLEAGAGLSSFGEDEAGELYVTDLSRGTVRRVVLQ